MRKYLDIPLTERLYSRDALAARSATPSTRGERQTRTLHGICGSRLPTAPYGSVRVDANFISASAFGAIIELIQRSFN